MIVLLLFALSTAQAVELPNNWTTCKKSSPKMDECLKSAIDKAIQDLVKGNPSLGVIPLDPLHFKRIDIKEGTGPVNVNMELYDTDVTGIRDVKVLKVHTDWKTMELHYSIPMIRYRGKYKASGKVLVLPIKGNGTLELEIENFKTINKIKFGSKTVKGKQYYTVEDYNISSSNGRVRMKFDNLFNGNKALGDRMNAFLNENWREITDELRPAINKAFSETFNQISNKLFSNVEKNVISPP